MAAVAPYDFRFANIDTCNNCSCNASQLQTCICINVHTVTHTYSTCSCLLLHCFVAFTTQLNKHKVISAVVYLMAFKFAHIHITIATAIHRSHCTHRNCICSFNSLQLYCCLLPCCFAATLHTFNVCDALGLVKLFAAALLQHPTSLKLVNIHIYNNCSCITSQFQNCFCLNTHRTLNCSTSSCIS